MGILLLIVIMPLFLSGQRAANHQNFTMDSASLYTARQRGSNEAQLEENVAMLKTIFETGSSADVPPFTHAHTRPVE